MADIAFDPTLQCPLIRNFECVQEECVYWNADKAQCILFDGLAGKEAYIEVSQLVSGVQTNLQIDLGARFRDLTIVVDLACVIRFHDATHPAVSLTATLGRVNNALIFRGINAQSVFITTTNDTNITIFGNG